jgi:hypothetical protein
MNDEQGTFNDEQGDEIEITIDNGNPGIPYDEE